jgi:hypothetical protein
MTADAALAATLRARQPFRHGPLTGEPVTPWNQSAEYQKWTHGSVARVFAGALNEHGTAGALNEHGTAGAITGGSGLPDLGVLDPAPAMAMALGEASYIVRSYGTPIAWWLGPEVYGCAPDGEWIEVAERCNREYGRFSATTTRHQNMVHAALTATA